MDAVFTEQVILSEFRKTIRDALARDANKSVMVTKRDFVVLQPQIREAAKLAMSLQVKKPSASMVKKAWEIIFEEYQLSKDAQAYMKSPIQKNESWDSAPSEVYSALYLMWLAIQGQLKVMQVTNSAQAVELLRIILVLSVVTFGYGLIRLFDDVFSFLGSFFDKMGEVFFPESIPREKVRGWQSTMISRIAEVGFDLIIPHTLSLHDPKNPKITVILEANTPFQLKSFHASYMLNMQPHYLLVLILSGTFKGTLHYIKVSDIREMYLRDVYDDLIKQ